MHESRASAPRESTAPEERVPYDPAEWSRRLQVAREARARVLAERDSARTPPRAEAPHLLREPVTGTTSPAQEELPAVETAGFTEQGRRGGGLGRPSGARWHLAAGFALGLAVSALLAVLLLMGTSNVGEGRSAAQTERGLALVREPV